MADRTITQLTAITSAVGADEIPLWVAGSGVTRKITRSNFLTGYGALATANIWSAKQTLEAGIAIRYLSMTASQTRPLSDWTGQTSGLVILHDSDGANVAFFAMQGFAFSTLELLDPAGQFSATIGVGASVNFAYETGAYRIRNNQAETRQIGVLVIGG